VTNLITSAGLIFILALSMYGWGRLFTYRLLPNNSFGWAYHVSFGMALWIFLGGVLNVLSIAKPQALLGIVIIGLSFLFYTLKTPFTQFLYSYPYSFKDIGILVKKINKKPNWLGYSVLYFFIFILICFYINSLMPSKVFTKSDDFWVYLARPLQMLGSGSLGNNSPFSSMPIDSLGGQSFMQAFFIMVLDYEYINGFDAILCFFISIFLVIEIAGKINVPFKILLLAVIIFIVWHPIISNTSTVYSATLLFLGAVSSLMFWYENGELTHSISDKIKMHIPFALFISAILTLKTTMALYAVIFFFFDFFVGLLLIKQRKPFTVAYVTTGLIIILITTPWLLVHFSKIVAVFQSMASSSNLDSNVLPASVSIWISILFNNMHLYWGGRLYWFLSIFLLMTTTACLAFTMLWKKRFISESKLWSTPIISLLLSITLYYFITSTVLPWGHAINHSVRYTTPGLLAAVSLLPLLLHSIYYSATPKLKTNALFSYSLIRTTIVPASLILIVIYIGMFSPLFVNRIQRLHNDNTMLAFMSKNARKHMVPIISAMSSVEHKNEMKKIQSLVPEGEKFLVWISTPFQLDFTRNPIENVATITSSWNKMVGYDIEQVLQSFKKRGIGYILWQSGGFSMRGRPAYANMIENNDGRTPHEGYSGVYIWDAFAALQKRGEILYDNKENKHVLFKLE
jgi:hypothetical protein